MAVGVGHQFVGLLGGGVEAVALFQQAHPHQFVFHLLVAGLGQLHLAVLLVQGRAITEGGQIDFDPHRISPAIAA